jgi:hypothetical protein
MAEVEVKIKVEGVDEATNSMQQLRKELKAAQSAALNGDGKAAKRVAELKDQIDDLKDATKTLQGSGVEKVTTSFNTLGEGFRNFDTDKIKLGFKGIGAAMSAIPIFLVVEGISYLVQNFDELSKGSGPLAKTLQAVGDALAWIGDKVGAVIDYFTDLTGVTSEATRALDAQAKQTIVNADKSTEALNSQIEAYDRQIAIAKASGKSTVEAEKAKQQAIIDTNLAIAKQIQADTAAGIEFDDERKKRLTASLAAIRAAKTEEKIIEIEDQKDKLEKYKEFLEKKRQQEAEFRQADIELEKQNEALKAELLNNFIKENNAQLRADINEAEIKDTVDYNLIRTKEEEEYQAYIRGLQLKSDAEELEAKRAKEAAALQITRDGLTSAQNLADIFFLIKKSKLQEGSKEEEKAARQQFNINKALQLSVATVTGIQSVQAAFLNGMKNPVPLLGPATAAVYAGVAAISSAASIAKIAATQYKSSGGTVTSDSTPVPSIPNVNTNISPNINANSNVQQSTFLGDDKPPIRVDVQVVETQSTKVQKRVSKLESQATF